MSAHTPGPWETNGMNIYGPLDPRSRHKNGRTLVGGVVDDMNDWRNRPSGDAIERAEFKAERLANARLIAAAPDLLEALERCERRIEEYVRLRGAQRPGVFEQAEANMSDASANARAAIAKAGGEIP